MEYVAVIIYAVIFFIVPVVGAFVFGWFWRRRRARRIQPLYIASRADDEDLGAS
jgi:Na+/proline symporter